MFHTIDVTQHDRNNHHLLCGKTLASKAVIPTKSTKRNKKTKQIRYSQVFLVYWHNRLFGTISAKTLITDFNSLSTHFYNGSKHTDLNYKSLSIFTLNQRLHALKQASGL